MMKTTSSPFTVTFGKVGRTVEYRDSAGCIVFTFDIQSEDRALILEHHAMHVPRPPSYAAAFAHTNQFLESRGYRVEEDGVAQPPAPLTEEEVLAFVRVQMPRPLPSFIQLVIPPSRARFRGDADGSSWNLWLIAKLEAGSRSRHKIVFDDQTKQFGVASELNVFLGFWGSFSQTTEALLAT